MKSHPGHIGLLFGWAIILVWAILTPILVLHGPSHPFLILVFILLQTHLYTGMFITAHDAMHGLVSKDQKWNLWSGRIAAFLFAFNSFDKLLPKHHDHHIHVASAKDPDYHPGNFMKWYWGFLKEYVSISQFLAMAITFQALFFFVPPANLVLFWMLPSILSTIQLFYFGTYLPHRGNHDPEDPYKARSQSRNHFLAFFSCYFFGYHREHHAKPWVPWWLLYRER